MRGDQLFFVETAYLYPLRWVVLPLVGAPSLRVTYAAGGAWRTGDERPAFEQNAGIGLQIRMLTAVVYVNPAERPRRAVLSLGVRLPGGAPRGGF
jgi:hypothetical protein